MAPAPVVVEAEWLVTSRLGPSAFAAVYEGITAGALSVIDLSREQWERVGQLCARYADLPLGLVDASVVAVAEKRVHDEVEVTGTGSDPLFRGTLLQHAFVALVEVKLLPNHVHRRSGVGVGAAADGRPGHGHGGPADEAEGDEGAQEAAPARGVAAGEEAVE